MGANAALITPYIDSGKAMVWNEDAITKDLGIDAVLGDFTAEFHAKLKFGLMAYAQLGGLGWFDAKLGIHIAVKHLSGVDILLNQVDDGLMPSEKNPAGLAADSGALCELDELDRRGDWRRCDGGQLQSIGEYAV